MCKCCQSCLESCYWHCFEKWFCYDDSIALYEDPLADEKDRRSFDNIAFWDSVAVIANRSVVTIQPLPNKNNSSLEQPILNNKSSSESENEHHSEAEKKVLPNTIQQSISEVDGYITQNKTNNDYVITITKPTPEKENIKLRRQSTIEEVAEFRQRGDSNTQEKFRKPCPIEEKIEQRQKTDTNALERNRKKSLKERRKSAAGLTLKLDNDFHEIPVIRQSSMPRFFIDTPEIDSLHGNYSGERSSVLVSPMLGNSPTFSYDLKSIVQIENEIMAHSKPSTPKSNRSSRLTQVRKKLKPIMIKKPSSKSLPDSINHM